MQPDTNKPAPAPKPSPAPPAGGLLTSLTIFLSMDERRAVLASLRRRDRDRRRALLLALRIEPAPRAGGSPDA